VVSAVVQNLVGINSVVLIISEFLNLCVRLENAYSRPQSGVFGVNLGKTESFRNFIPLSEYNILGVTLYKSNHVKSVAWLWL